MRARYLVFRPFSLAGTLWMLLATIKRKLRNCERFELVRIDMRDVELFVAVVDRGSITEGAQSVGLSLSAASSRITAMEKGFGLSLLLRGRGGVVPTPAGEAFMARGRSMVAQADDLVEVLRHHRDGQASRIRLASNTSAVDALTEFLASTLSRFPDLHVVLEEAPSTDVARRVREGSADLGVVSVLHSDTGLAVHRLWADPLVIVRAPRPLDSAASMNDDAEVTFEEAIRGPMIGLTEGVPLQAFIDEHAHRLGVTPDYRVRLPTLGAVYAVASTGAGTAILPQGTARRLGAPERLVHPMSEPWAQRQALLLTRTDGSASGVEASFVEAMLRYRNEVLG